MRRRRLRRALWGSTALALMIVAVFFNHSAKPTTMKVVRGGSVVDVPGYSSNGTLEHPSDDDVAQVVKALDTRARAVIDGHRAAFLGTVDTDRSAFTAHQRIVWQNTRQLPFETLSYHVDGIVEPDKPLSTPSFLARVTTTYQLRGFDSAPIEVEDGFTFVKQDGTWKLAGIADADRQFSQKNLPAPWDGGPIVAYAGGHYLAIVDRGRRALARRVVALCHRGSRTSREFLGLANTRPTVVLATSHEPGFEKFSGPEAEAVTYPLAGPDGTTSGWGVVVNPHDVDDAVARPVVLSHELTHVATQDYLAYLPAWLAEGTAEYVGWNTQGGLSPATAARSYGLARPLPPTLPISSSFYLDDIRLNYVKALALVSWLEEHRGRSAVLSLLQAYADAGAWDVSYDPDDATASVLHDQLGMTPRELAEAAYADMNATVGSS